MKSYQIYGYTTVGPVRQTNEDHILIGRFIKNQGGLGLYLAQEDDFIFHYGMIFAVADGVGGAHGGATASKLAILALERQFYATEKKNQPIDTFITVLKSALERANDTILQVAASQPDFSKMGCTISGVCFTPMGYLVFNAGDSRVYRYRNGVLKALTQDDTLTNIAVRSGTMTFAEAEESSSRHTITNCLGSNSFEPQILKGPELRDGDTILICSDGLHDLINHDQLEMIFSNNQTVEELAHRSVNEAVANGGHDNISVIVIRYGSFETMVGWRQKEIMLLPSDDIHTVKLISFQEKDNNLVIGDKNEKA